MSKQQFFAELGQYLTFVSPDQRNDIITYFSEKLEQVGPDREAEALAEIGTPMSVAITLKRRLEAHEPLIPDLKPKPSPPLENTTQDNEIKSSNTPCDEANKKPEATSVQQEDSSAQTPEPIETDKPESALNEESVSDPELKKETDIQEKKKISFGRVLGAIGISILGVIIAAFFVCIAAFGGIICGSSIEIIISGVNAINYLVNALIILAGGMLALAAGLLIICFAIWAAIMLITLMLRKFKGGPAPEKSISKSFWVLVLIILVVLVSIALICGTVSMLMGGNISILQNDSSFIKMFSRLDPSNILGYLNQLV